MEAISEILARLERNLDGVEPHSWPVPVMKDDLRALIDTVKSAPDALHHSIYTPPIPATPPKEA